MKTCIVVGTRPEIIKMSPVIRECDRLGLDYYVLHTGQHYSYGMDQVFFDTLKLPAARYRLNAGSGSHARQTAKILNGVERILQRDTPSVALVQGDTNTVLAGALAAVKLGIPVGHVEAGLRSYDRRMPEEINRVVADHVADLLFAPTERARKTLLNEGIPQDKVYLTGNTVVDAICRNLELSANRRVLKNLGLERWGYFLATVHRQENVDDKARFQGIMHGSSNLSKATGLPVVYPVHPRARKKMREFGLKAEGVRLTSPVDYLDFLQLEKNAKVVLTDSGGVQEEACVLGVPCVTLRDNTERQETLEIGANVLAGTDPALIVEKAMTMCEVRRSWKSPFGDGRAGKRILEIVRAEMLDNVRGRRGNP